MILSASRRTDIPNYYSEWFFNRIREGFCYVRNPMNPAQISRISLSAEVVDCIVFWTKNPQPMLDRLGELSAYPYYFQFTLTGYGADIERGVPHKKDRMIPIFQRLSEQIGNRRVIWRYDPILFNERYTPEYHVNAFGQIAEKLCGYTQRCVISFVDEYAKNRRSMQQIGAVTLPQMKLYEFAKTIGRLAKENGMTVASCAEALDLAACGIEKNCCIDRMLIEELTGWQMKVGKDKNQRVECGCVESIDIGTYNTCPNGCRYCYASYSPESVAQSRMKYDPVSPLLCGSVRQGDKITERKVKSLKI